MAPSPKIAIVIPGFQSSTEDWCIPVFTNLAREISSRAELHVFALRYPHRRDTYMVGDVHVHALGGGAWSGLRIPGMSLLKLWRDSLLAIHGENARAPFKAVVGIWATESGWLATRAGMRLGLPSLVHLAGGELTYIPQLGYGNRRRNLAGRLVESTLGMADLLTVPSGPMRSALLRRVNASKVCDWAPGVNTSMFAPAPRRQAEDKSFQFVTAGSLMPVKGHALLLRALAKLRDQEREGKVRLRIVGDGPLGSALERLVGEMHLDGYVAIGGVAHDMLPAIYNQSDAFVLSSWHESQCMAALEAMACGLPWAGPPVGALADVAAASREHPTGILFQTRDPDQVAAAMRSLIELSPAVRGEYGRAARAMTKRNYDMVRQADAFLQLIARLTER
jgi:glycosyltransferase involved in cell wall biosynthesis